MTNLIQAGLIISLMAIGASSRKIKVFKTTNNFEKFKDGSGAKFRNVRDFELVDFSVCNRFLFFGKQDNTALIYSKHDQDTLASSRVIFGVTEVMANNWDKIWIGLLNVSITNFIPWPAREWHHICLSYTNNSSVITLVSNGGTHFKKVTLEHLKKNPTPIPPEFLTNLFIMRASTTEITEEKIFWSMFGKMTDVNIWNYTMTVEEMNSWTNCINTGGGGNVVNWEIAEWTTWDLEVENVDKSEICQVEKKPGLTIFPQRRTFRESLEL